MNLSGAIGGAIAGVIIATLSYGWLCGLSMLPVSAMTIFAVSKLKK
jgi:hypothetical protein